MEKKKSLGQHFLKSQSALDAIVGALDPTAVDIVVEIGPGEGVLTEKILPLAAKVIAIEKDSRLIPLLQKKFAKYIEAGRFDLIEGDALEFDPAALQSYDLKKFDYKVVGNIPYYITGALLKKFLSETTQPSTIVFLIQKEVAQRIARDKKESILSLSVKAYGTPRYIKTVPAGAFSPPPEVDSAILAIQNISRHTFADPAQEQKFFEIVRAGFAHKRKLLARNLESVLGEQTLEAMRAAQIPAKARAEEVDLTRWVSLTRY